MNIIVHNIIFILILFCKRDPEPFEELQNLPVLEPRKALIVLYLDNKLRYPLLPCRWRHFVVLAGCATEWNNCACEEAGLLSAGGTSQSFAAFGRNQVSFLFCQATRC